MTTVWLHGAALGPAMWDPARARGLRLALPGHAGRPRAAAPTVAAMADALLPDCPARFDLVGHSLGGQIAMQIAADAPGRVRRLVLVETAISTHGTLAHRIGSALARAFVAGAPRAALVRLVPIRQRGRARAVLRAGLEAVDRAALRDAVAASTRFDAAPVLARIAAPVLVLVGRDNPITHAQGRRIAAGVARGRFAVVPGGHLAPLDDPAAFHAAVDPFLAEAEPCATPLQRP